MICHVCWVRDYPRLSFRGGSLYTSHDDIDDEAYKSEHGRIRWPLRGNTRESLENFKAFRVCGRYRVNCHKCTLDFWSRPSAFSSANSNPQSNVQWTPSEFRGNKETGQRKETRCPERIENETHMHSEGTRNCPKLFTRYTEATRSMIVHRERIIGTSYRRTKEIQHARLPCSTFLWQVHFIADATKC